MKTKKTRRVGERRLKELEASIRAAELGITKVIPCPYCGADLDFTPPSAFSTESHTPPICCETFALAVIAILQRQEQNEMKQLADRIGDRVGGQAVFN